ncbi:DUF58 domain-containing protein [Cryobacterium sp. MLB-32]|uniref:DUF58 domain-containing protein n=1 Tax=Cryobacterium sp. MLB-32 TaxID=1529318 RepID=UPI0009DFE42E|nr:DUF58 domain-containing protein [Cryobacterium sp. MLB-32]
MSDTVTRTRGVVSDPLPEGRMAVVVGVVLERSRAVRVRLLGGFRILGAVVTPLGWSLATTVLVSFVLGYRGGWTELVAIAWAGVVLLGAALAYLIGRAPYSIALEMTVDRVVVGENATGTVSVLNSSRRRLPGVSVEVPVGDGLVVFDMPALRRSAGFADDFAVPTIRRGVVVVGPVRTVRGDPIGLVRKERVWADRTELFVHPRTISIPSMSTGLIRDLEGNPTRDLATNDVSFNSLREYVPGDERRSIHWKSTAKTGTLMVRQFEETRRSHLMVVVSLSERDYETDDEFELAVSVAGSLGVRAIRDGRTVSVVVSALTPPFARRRVPALRSLNTVTRPRLLDDLSRIEPVGSALPLPDLAGLASDSVTGISVAFLICGSALTARELRAAASRFSAGVEVVAVICEPEAAPSLRRVGTLSVLTVGFLEDLQKSLARSKAA